MRRLLFVTRIFPEDFAHSVFGIYQRMRMFLDAATEVADDLHILFYVRPAVAAAGRAAVDIQQNLSEHWGIRASVTLSPLHHLKTGNSAWHQYGRPALGIDRQEPYAPMSGQAQLAAFERCLDAHPDAVFIHRLAAMGPALKTSRALPPLLFDLDDIEHVKFLGQRQPPHWRSKYFRYLQFPALLLGERRAIRLASKTFVCSDHDRDYLSRRLRLNRIVTVPNSVSVPELIDLGPASLILAFLGSYNYDPNIAAAEYLVKNVWPLVREEVPGARLVIAGNRAQQLPSFVATSPDVHFAGFVDDLAAFYRHAQVICCPILSGGGTRIKMIEAAAYGKAIVSSTIGAEGLTLRNGEHLVLADGASNIAHACIALLRDPDRCRELGMAARSLVIADYDREEIVARITQELRVR